MATTENFPPRLSPPALFWSGLSVVLGSIVVNVLITQLVYEAGLRVPIWLSTIISPVITSLTVIGAVMLGGALVARTVQRGLERPVEADRVS